MISEGCVFEKIVFFYCVFEKIMPLWAYNFKVTQKKKIVYIFGT